MFMLFKMWSSVTTPYSLVPTFRRDIITLSFILKMKTVCFSETLVHSYQTTRCHNPEDENINHHRENLKHVTPECGDVTYLPGQRTPV
jgi:hypothetical protein